MVTERIDERALSKLKWRCRRGLLENDLFIERFFARHEDQLTIGQAEALTRLMDLSDNDGHWVKWNRHRHDRKSDKGDWLGVNSDIGPER